MGMGDSKPIYTPKYKPLKCAVTGLSFASVSMRECPHEAVRRAYGGGGAVNVSIWVCKRCKYGEKSKFDGGVKCVYGKT